MSRCIFSSNSRIEALQAKEYLENKGINTYVRNLHVQNLLIAGSIEIYVDEHDVDDAFSLLSEFFETIYNVPDEINTDENIDRYKKTKIIILFLILGIITIFFICLQNIFAINDMLSKIGNSTVNKNNIEKNEKPDQNFDKSSEKKPDFLSNYYKYVVYPSRENPVILENSQYILIFKPDLIYTLTNKETKIITESRAMFLRSTNFSIDARIYSRTYLFEPDISATTLEKVSRNNYQEISEIILLLVNCTETEVTYKYEKPVALQENIITFSITEM